MFKYNKDGYLMPYQAIEVSLEDVKEELIGNERRKELFEKLEEFIAEFKIIHHRSTCFWMNGSFVSKKEYPKDIDVVFFVNYSNFKAIEESLIRLRYNFGKWLDVYYVVVYPEGHKYHNLTLWQKSEYFELYASTRPSQITGMPMPKGFLEVKI